MGPSSCPCKQRRLGQSRGWRGAASGRREETPPACPGQRLRSAGRCPAGAHAGPASRRGPGAQGRVSGVPEAATRREGSVPSPGGSPRVGLGASQHPARQGSASDRRARPAGCSSGAGAPGEGHPQEAQRPLSSSVSGTFWKVREDRDASGPWQQGVALTEAGNEQRGRAGQRRARRGGARAAGGPGWPARSRGPAALHEEPRPPLSEPGPELPVPPPERGRRAPGAAKPSAGHREAPGAERREGGRSRRGAWGAHGARVNRSGLGASETQVRFGR